MLFLKLSLWFSGTNHHYLWYKGKCRRWLALVSQIPVDVRPPAKVALHVDPENIWVSMMRSKG